ncbi:MAG: hypothetical protein ABIF40_04885 [archaeon]
MISAKKQFEYDQEHGVDFYIWTILNWEKSNYPEIKASNVLSAWFQVYMGFKGYNEETDQYIHRMIQKTEAYKYMDSLYLCKYQLGLEFYIDDEIVETKRENKRYYDNYKLKPWAIADLTGEIDVRHHNLILKYQNWGRIYPHVVKQNIQSGKVLEINKPNVVKFDLESSV